MEINEFKELSNNYKNGEERGKLKDYLKSPVIFPQKKNIVFSTPSETGTSYFRCLEPMFSMMRNSDEFNLIYTETIGPEHFCFADMIVMHRADMKHSNLIKISKAFPKTIRRPLILHDVDDLN